MCTYTTSLYSWTHHPSIKENIFLCIVCVISVAGPSVKRHSRWQMAKKITFFKKMVGIHLMRRWSIFEQRVALLLPHSQVLVTSFISESCPLLLLSLRHSICISWCKELDSKINWRRTHQMLPIPCVRVSTARLTTTSTVIREQNFSHWILGPDDVISVFGYWGQMMYFSLWILGPDDVFQSLDTGARWCYFSLWILGPDDVFQSLDTGARWCYFSLWILGPDDVFQSLDTGTRWCISVFGYWG